MRLRLSGVIFAVVVSIALAAQAHAAEITLTGTLAGAGGQPKAFALVQLEGARRYAAVTGIDGGFTITKFETGTYMVRIRQKDDVETHTQIISSSPLSLSVKW